jgi:multisubunit Na+/H+ antiporter MnhB subunit
MSGYHPDWLGALTAGVAIGLSILIGTRIWPQQDRRKSVTIIAIFIGAALAIAARTVLRRFGF